jgi:hypothetical protein
MSEQGEVSQEGKGCETKVCGVLRERNVQVGIGREIET